MARRSSRLVSGGYYNSDEESDSSSVTNISYRENPVKVFKKKAATRKAGSRTPSRANASSAEKPVTAAGSSSPSPLNSPSQPTMRTTPCVSTTPTPRPPLTPARCPSAPPEKSAYAALCGSTVPGLHLRPNKQLSQSAVDSSGYSSSEGPHRKPSRTSGTSSAAPSAGYRSRVSRAFTGLMESTSLLAAALQSKIMHLSALAADASLSRRMKKACGLFLLLLLCLLFLLPLLTSLISSMATKTQPQINPRTQPVLPAATPPRPPSAARPPALDPAVVAAAVESRIQQLLDPAALSAAVEAKMQRLLEEQQLKQQQLLSQVKERLQQDLQEVTARLEAVDSESRLRLQRELSELDRRLLGEQADGRSAAASLHVQIQALEAQSVKLSQEWSSLQLRLPPEPSSPPVQNQLTPELQEALEKWLSGRVQEASRLQGSCGRPVADKMADFALETQGASVISTRCSETYRIRSACVTLFGFPLWYPSESPRTVIQGFPVLLPGKCWAFHGVQGTLVISLSHPVQLTHVTLDHLPRYSSPTGRIDSAPKDFQVYGLKNDTDEGVLLGTFTYDENGESTQTFELPTPTSVAFRCVELRVLSNWGHVEYTCLYRFRVHGRMAST